MSVPIVPEMILNRPNRSYTILSSDDSDEDDNGDDDILPIQSIRQSQRVKPNRQEQSTVNGSL